MIRNMSNPDPLLSEREIDDAARMFKALSNPHRLRIFKELSCCLAGRVAIGPAEASVESGLEILLPTGNTDWLTVRLTLPATTPVRVTVHDIVGREVAVFCEGAEYAQGTHALAVPVARWRSGAYFFTLHTSAGQVTEKALILH